MTFPRSSSRSSATARGRPQPARRAPWRCWFVLLFLAAGGARAAEPVPIYFFWGEGCPHCAAAEPFLTELAARDPNVVLHAYEVYYQPDNQRRFAELAAAHGFDPGGVPTIFVGYRHWVGYSPAVRAEIEAVVSYCLESGCPDPAARLAEPWPELTHREVAAPVAAPPDSAAEEPGRVLDLPLLGAIDLEARSLLVSTLLIAFVDGFNPCSLWVLSLLLALVLHSGSRRKVFAVGATFLLVTSLVYALFIAGLVNILAFVGYLGWVRAAVALLALGFALINIKDYFWLGRGVSLTIADSAKPGIYRAARRVMAADRSLPAMMAATAAMALGITLVELPCTAGFPVVWSNLLAGQAVAGLAFLGLLGLYLLVYLLDEAVVFLSVVVTLRASRLEEAGGRALKLIGGMVMLALALVLLIAPEWMNQIASTLLVFAAALLGAGLVLLVHRGLLPLWRGRAGGRRDGAPPGTPSGGPAGS